MINSKLKLGEGKHSAKCKPSAYWKWFNLYDANLGRQPSVYNENSSKQLGYLSLLKLHTSL